MLNPRLSEQLKFDAFEVIELSGQDFLATMRGQARRICMKKGKVASDDLRAFADGQGIKPKSSAHWGAVFNSPEFIFHCHKKSAWVSNHGREIKVWKLK